MLQNGLLPVVGTMFDVWSGVDLYFCWEPSLSKNRAKRSRRGLLSCLKEEATCCIVGDLRTNQVTHYMEMYI